MDTYEHKYNELVSFLKELRNCMNTYAKEKLEGFIPELRESEDEKVRKELYKYFRDLQLSSDSEFSPSTSIDEILAWLEKRGEQKLYMIQWKGDNLKEVIGFAGKNKNFDKWFTSFEEYERYVHEHNNIFKLFNEDGSHYEVPVGAWIVKTPDGYNVASKAVFKQKPADKIEPKFNVGDWVMLDRPVLITKVEDMPYNTHQYWTSDGKWFGDATKAKLWTIQDAKDGDVLATLDYILVFKEFLKNDDGISYCHYDFGSENSQFIWFEDNNWYFGKEAIIHPATKEQRDLLFSKMKEAGYEWDAEKKELKKVEKTSADETPCPETLEKAIELYYYSYGNGEGEFEHLSLEKFRDIVHTFVSDYGQKPVWSEDDERILYNVIAYIGFANGQRGVRNDAFKEANCWLNSLKDRVQPQPKQEWNESNDSMIEGIKIAILNYYDKENADEIISWLESIKERVQP